jgi:hypothetical protein
MVGSWGHWGEGATPEQADQPTFLQTALQVLPIAQTLAEQLADDCKNAQAYRYKLQQAKMSGQSQAYLANLQAKIDAADRGCASQVETQQAKTNLLVLGQIGAVVGVGIGASIIVFIIARAFR